jgi:iron complex transport system substrate-binding protein
LSRSEPTTRRCSTRKTPAKKETEKMTKTIERPREAYPAIEEITRREFLVGGAGLLALGIAGCGSGEAGEEASGETRTAEGYYGPVELPVRPQRVIPGYTSAMDFVLVLGLPMAAGTGMFGAATEDFPEYQREAYPEVLEDLEIVQAVPANYEQIAAAEPDCIVDNVAAFDEERYERLSEIAPTFVYLDYEPVEGLEEPGKSVWRKPLRQIGRAFGREERAEEFIEGYEARAGELKERLAERWAGAKFAFMEPNTEGIYIHGTLQDPMSQVLFEDLGAEPASLLTRNPQQLSLEALPEIDADVLFLSIRPQEGSLERDLETVAPYVESPLWQKIPAVEKGQVYRLQAELLYTSPLVAQAFLDFVEDNLLT